MGPQPSQAFDGRLRQMLQERPPGREYGQREIARFCGVSHTLVQYIENRAYKKLRALGDDPARRRMPRLKILVRICAGVG